MMMAASASGDNGLLRAALFVQRSLIAGSWQTGRLLLLDSRQAHGRQFVMVGRVGRCIGTSYQRLMAIRTSNRGSCQMQAMAALEAGQGSEMSRTEMGMGCDGLRCTGDALAMRLLMYRTRTTRATAVAYCACRERGRRLKPRLLRRRGMVE